MWLVLYTYETEMLTLQPFTMPGGVATRLTSVCVPFHRSLGVVLYELCTLEHAFQGQVCVCVCTCVCMSLCMVCASVCVCCGVCVCGVCDVCISVCVCMLVNV